MCLRLKKLLKFITNISAPLSLKWAGSMSAQKMPPSSAATSNACICHGTHKWDFSIWISIIQMINDADRTGNEESVWLHADYLTLQIIFHF